METNEVSTALGAIIVIAIFVAIGPLLTLWALNTLFPMLNIPYDFTTWCAVVILGAAFKTNVKVNK